MFLIFCSKYDQEVAWLKSRLQHQEDFDTEYLYAEDLYECKNWQVQQTNDTSYSSVILPNGRLVDNNNVTLFLNRVDFLKHPYWDKLPQTEQQYFLRQWNACMFQWLKAFEAVLINKPLPGMLAGFSTSRISWQLLAKKAGFEIRDQYFSSDYCDASVLLQPAISPGCKKIQMFNGRVLAPLLPTTVNEACVALSLLIGCKMFEISVSSEQGKYYFQWASCMPQISTFPSGFVRALVELAQVSQTQEPKLRSGIESHQYL